MRGGGSDVEKSALWFAVGVGVAAAVFAPHPKPGRRPRALTGGLLPSRDSAPHEQEFGLAPKTLMSVTSKPVSDPLTPSSSTSTVEAPVESAEAAEYLPEVSQAGPEHERAARNLRASNARAEAPVLRAVIAEEEPEEEPLLRAETRAAGNSSGLALVLPRGAVDLEEQSRKRQPGQGAFNMCSSSTTELALATFARRIRPQLPPAREPVFIDRDDDTYNIPLADNAFAPLPAPSGINAAVWVVLAVVLCLAAAVAYNMYDSRQQWAAIHDGLQQASQTQTYQSEQARQLDQRAWVGLAANLVAAGHGNRRWFHREDPEHRQDPGVERARGQHHRIAGSQRTDRRAGVGRAPAGRGRRPDARRIGERAGVVPELAGSD